jgi:hypothetical protein
MLSNSTNVNPQLEIKSESYLLTRWLFLRGFGLIYLSAFASYAVQIIGLNGSHGILPVQEMLQQVHDQLGPASYWFFPTVFWLNSSDACLQWVTYIGTILSFFVILGIMTGPVLLVLAVLWLSLVTAGGEFTAFQSDGMLVEATFLTLFFVPWQWFEPPWPVPLSLRQQFPPSKISIWLLRFMIFRIMFASGLVKILSGDPTYRDLTALTYHYETQPIPTPLAWYAHHLPVWIQKISVLGMFVSELVAPLLIFTIRPLRIVAGILMFFLQLLIALTGNYTYLSFLMMLLCVPLWDDRLLEKVFPRSLTRALQDSQISTPLPRWRRLSVKYAGLLFIFLAAGQTIMTVAGRGAVPTLLRSTIAYLSPLRIIDSYGLFAVMTTTRPEIVFEGSEDGKTWKAYEFKYKPGDDLKRPPPWVEPHMPRLDWRLWFAAMEPVDASPWVLNLVERLLDGSPDVKGFFAVNPFAEKPPKYVRAFVYDYHFTDEQTRVATGCWWRRDNKSVYLPPVTLKQDDL